MQDFFRSARIVGLRYGGNFGFVFLYIFHISHHMYISRLQDNLYRWPTFALFRQLYYALQRKIGIFEEIFRGPVLYGDNHYLSPFILRQLHDFLLVSEFIFAIPMVLANYALWFLILCEARLILLKLAGKKSLKMTEDYILFSKSVCSTSKFILYLYGLKIALHYAFPEYCFDSD